jgi:hypothetical protein
MDTHIVVKKLNNIIDVFHGREGWEQDHWTRFLLIKGFLKYIKGASLSPEDFLTVKKQLGL